MFLRRVNSYKFSYITARPKHYKQNSAALPEAKKNLIEQIKAQPDARLFFMDEARFGTHSKLGHGWFTTGQRSRVDMKLGFKNFYVYSSVEPKTGEVFSLIQPKVNTVLMNLYLTEMSKQYEGEKIILIMDGAGWHKSKKLIIPQNITIHCLPPYSLELNPVERFWLHAKKNVIRNKVYETIDTLETAVCNFLNTILSISVAQICTIDWFD